MNKYVNKIIDLYTKDSMSEFAKIKFHQWLVDEDKSSEKEAALLRLWNETDDVAEKDTLASFVSLQTKSELYREKKRNAGLTFWRYAAAIAMVVALSSTFVYVRHTSSSEPGFTEYFSQAGKTDTVTLPDGSVAQVNSGSLILYPKTYGKDTRTIYLYGEANFKVKKNANVPFIVKSKNFSVTALGTEFDVSAYSDDPCFKTTLITGSIKVQPNDHPEKACLLKVNEQFVYNTLTGQHSISAVDVFEATAWQRGELLFRGASMTEVFSVLERKYAVSFQYKSTVFNDDKYNFRFKKESSLTDVMDVIKGVSGGFTCKKVGDSYYINK